MFIRARVSLVLVALVLAGAITACDAYVDQTARSSGGVSTGPSLYYEVGPAELPRIITVSGEGAATAAPDIADIRLGVESINEDPAVAISEDTVAMTRVIDSLVGVGVDEDDIKTLSFNMWIEQIYDRNGPTGELRYHVVNQMAVRVRDIDMTGDVLGAALAAGANNVGGVTFTVEDMAALEQVARNAAVDNAVSKAEQLARRLSVALGSTRQVSEVSSSLPSPISVERGMALEASIGGSGVPITPGDLTVNVSVDIIFDFES